MRHDRARAATSERAGGAGHSGRRLPAGGNRQGGQRAGAGLVQRAGFTCRYRLPQPGRDRQAALADAQRALRVVRDQAARRGLEADNVAVMAFRRPRLRGWPPASMRRSIPHAMRSIS